tara:strand:- start:132 stop:347 length:216 start_codon:yes stop_codon:yes gene_type:complete
MDNRVTKSEVAEELCVIMDRVNNRVKVLSTLDDYDACSTYGDLADQLISISHHSKELTAAIGRARDIAEDA